MLVNINAWEIGIFHDLVQGRFCDRKVLFGKCFIFESVPHFLVLWVDRSLVENVIREFWPVLNAVDKVKSFLQVFIVLLVYLPANLSLILSSTRISLLLTLQFKVLDLFVQWFDHTFISLDRLNSKCTTGLVVLVVHGVNQKHFLLCFQFYVLIVLLPQLGL